MRGAIFCYHSQNCGGYDSIQSDHVALAENLELVARYRLPIVSLHEVALSLRQPDVCHIPSPFVAFSCDDGTKLDWVDYQHPLFGCQRSFANIMRDHCSKYSVSGKALITSFVIASPEARSLIDEGCYEGLRLSTEEWWLEASLEGLMSIENHSWDHAHKMVGGQLISPEDPGSFYNVRSEPLAEAQILQAHEYINSICSGAGHISTLFAYPYGQTNDFLTKEFLPKQGEEAGILGAFSTAAEFVSKDTERFAIPRLVCGEHWRLPCEFEDILTALIT